MEVSPDSRPLWLADLWAQRSRYCFIWVSLRKERAKLLLLLLCKKKDSFFEPLFSDRSVRFVMIFTTCMKNWYWFYCLRLISVRCIVCDVYYLRLQNLGLWIILESRLLGINVRIFEVGCFLRKNCQYDHFSKKPKCYVWLMTLSRKKCKSRKIPPLYLSSAYCLSILRMCLRFSTSGRVPISYIAIPKVLPCVVPSLHISFFSNWQAKHMVLLRPSELRFSLQDTVFHIFSEPFFTLTIWGHKGRPTRGKLQRFSLLIIFRWTPPFCVNQYFQKIPVRRSFVKHLEWCWASFFLNLF